jgi:hypothetical protein
VSTHTHTNTNTNTNTIIRSVCCFHSCFCLISNTTKFFISSDVLVRISSWNSTYHSSTLFVASKK